MQTKFDSFLEAIANILIGYIVAIIGQIVIFPLFSIDIPLKSNMVIGLCFTVISLIRSYTIRRMFNGGIVKCVKKSLGIRG
jgi:hypothetical protein